MKKRRRIEITTFRSRTTITVRHQDQLVESPCDGATTVTAPPSLPQREEVDLKPRQIAESPRSGLATINLKGKKPSEGEQQ